MVRIRDFPDIISQHPTADIPIDGAMAHLVQAGQQQFIFMHFDKDAEVAEHSHEAQWGVVLEGQMELTINGQKKILKKGDTYFIDKDVTHSAKIKAGYTDLTLFNQADRYKIKNDLTTDTDSMAQKVNPIPYKHQNIIPYIMVGDVKKLITFLQSAFDAQLDYKLDRNDGTIMHAEVVIGKNKIMMGEPNEQFGAMPVSIYLYVADCDKVYTNAIRAGATSMSEVKTMVHAGERYGCVRDFAGNIWWIASHVEDMTLEESQRRINEMGRNTGA